MVKYFLIFLIFPISCFARDRGGLLREGDIFIGSAYTETGRGGRGDAKEVGSQRAVDVASSVALSSCELALKVECEIKKTSLRGAMYLRLNYRTSAIVIASRKVTTKLQINNEDELRACLIPSKDCVEKFASKVLCELNTDGTLSYNGNPYTSSKEVNSSTINILKDFYPNQINGVKSNNISK